MNETTFEILERKEIELTEAQKLSLYGMISHGCRKSTKDKLHARIVEYFFYSRLQGWMKERLTIQGDIVHYTVGQDWNYELPYIRKYILNH